MPLRGFIKIFSLKIFIPLSVLFIAVTLIGLINPKSAFADFVLRGGTCYFRYGNTSGQTQELPVDINFCTGGQGNGACMANLAGECRAANVPGGGGSGCTTEDIITEYTPAGQTPQYIRFQADCSATWSNGINSQDYGLNIAYFRTSDRKYTDLTSSRSALGMQQNNSAFKIANGNSGVTIPMSWFSGEMADYTTEKSIGFYPNCAGSMDDAMEADCFRIEDLEPYIPPPPPPCTMPLEQVSFTTSCTPGAYSSGVQKTTDVVHALNLNQGGNYCQIDYINVSTVQNPSFPNYYNSAVNGVSEKAIPQGFTYRGDGSNLILQPNTTYWISYYDSQSGQLSAGRSFVTRGSCSTPSAPTISQVPQCRFTFPYDTEPERDRINLKWGAPSNQGLGFEGYEIQIANNSAFTGAQMYSNTATDRDIPFGAPAYSSNIPLGYTYYYRVRGVNWGGSGSWSAVRSGYIQMKPSSLNSLTLGVTPPPTPTGNAVVDIDWTYTNTVIAPPDPVSGGFFGTRTGGSSGMQNLIAQGTQRTLINNIPASACQDTNYTYTLSASNVCGDGPATSRSVVCPRNTPPTCGALQYLNGSSWQNFHGSGVTRNRSTTIQIRRLCTDPEGNPITYSWVTSCGSVSPSNTATTTYTFPSTANTSCDILSGARDNFNAYAPSEAGIANTNPTAGISSLTLAPDSRSIQRSSTADAYAVIRRITQNLATMRYTVSGYNNPAFVGAPAGVNATASITIDTLSANVATNIVNICNPTYGTCGFDNGGGTSMGMSATNASYLINVSFNATQLANVKDVMVGSTATTPIRFGMIVNFNARGADGSLININRSGTPSIINNPPYCVSVNIDPRSPLRTGTTNITVTARDDWGLNQINVGVSPAGGSLTSTDVNTITGNPRSGSTTVPWNITNAATGVYSLNATITDLDGRSATCNASSAVTGSENPGGGTGTPPTIMVDKVVPVCTPGSFTVTSVDGVNLAFAVRGSDPGTVASGLAAIDISVLRPGTGQTWQPAGSSAVINPPVTTYNYSDATGYNVANAPSGTYNFRATWTDEAGNTATCAATYDKGSRISGRIMLNTGTNGDQLRDYANESTGTRFNPVSRLGVAAPTSANWNIATNTNCSAPYPGTSAAASDTGACNAWFISNAEYATSSTPTIGIRFPALSSNATIPKYRCTAMRLFNTVVSSSTPTKTFTGATVVPINCVGGVCGCDVTLASGDITVNSNATYTATSIWPTHVEFDLDYNSDQVYGTIRNERGSAIQNVTVTAGGVTPAGTSNASGSYETPIPAGDNSAGYLRSGLSGSPVSTTVTLTNNDPTKLCIHAVKTDFTNNASRNTVGNFDSAAEVSSIAKTLSVPGTGWSVAADDACTATVQVANGTMSPKYQNQVNYLLIPKVKVTGRIYFLNKDNLCGSPAAWSDSANQASSGSVPLTLTMQTDTGLTDFYNPDGDSSYNTGDSYTYYANILPGSTWNTWQLQKTVSFAAGSPYTSCGNDTINVATSLPNYPYDSSNPTRGYEISSDIAVYVREANDWWQTYNGGVHGLAGIQNAIPNESLPVEVGGFDMHTMVGVPNNVIYSAASSPSLIKNGFRPSTSGALVTTRGNIGTINAGRSGANWQISGDKAWKQDSMPALRIPFAGEGASSVEAIDKVRALTSGNWPTSMPNFSTSGSNNKVILSGNQTIGSSSSDTTYGNNNYILVDGDVTIAGNLKPSGTNLDQTLFIVASGDVTIAAGVAEINAFIYTPGDINIATAGQDSSSEKVLRVYGGLYAGGTIHQRRDIENTPTNFGYPSVQVMFNPGLIISTRSASFPSQLKDTNVYWTQE